MSAPCVVVSKYAKEKTDDDGGNRRDVDDVPEW
jgi:hypothetical protein